MNWWKMLHEKYVESNKEDEETEQEEKEEKKEVVVEDEEAEVDKQIEELQVRKKLFNKSRYSLNKNAIA